MSPVGQYGGLFSYRNRSQTLVSLVVVLALLGGLNQKHVTVTGHGMMLDPPARSSMWRLGFKTPTNYDDNGLNCGGRSVIIHLILD